MADNLINSNNELHKERAFHYKKAIKLMFKAILKKTPKEIVIDVLMEEKIIKRDWCAKGVKYEKK